MGVTAAAGSTVRFRTSPRTWAHGGSEKQGETFSKQMKLIKSAAAGSILLVCGLAQGPIRLQTRTFEPARGAVIAPPRARSGPAPPRAHYIVQFAAFPGADVRRELERRGISILSYIPDSALMVSSASAADLRGLGAVWAGPMEPSDKLSPRVAEAKAYLVEFYPDVDAGLARAILGEHGFSVIQSPGLLPGHWVTRPNAEALPALAAHDEVSFILPATAAMAAGTRVSGCTGALTDAGTVGDYATVGSGWPADSNGAVPLQYAFQSLPANLDAEQARGVIATALNVWAGYVNVIFSAGGGPETTRTINVLTAGYSHGDGYPFDGPGGVLAHTFYPAPVSTEPLAGDMHFDASETWRIGANTDLFSVALHEAGHALGMGHSTDPASVMYPYYHLVTGLSAGDIAGIRSLYPSAGAENPRLNPGPSPGQPSAPSGGNDTTPPTLHVVSPASTIVSTSYAVIFVSGTASDSSGVASVTWSTSTGGAGTASGTANWSFQAPLLVGANVVTVRAWDAAGNSSWRTITVMRN
ncbi:MAG TPA: matrixin family metalloprotease [Bryobacteraceae bacterium]|nr:matrixin family metalloprotease [Bryobacteraceae bacterium]